MYAFVANRSSIERKEWLTCAAAHKSESDFTSASGRKSTWSVASSENSVENKEWPLTGSLNKQKIISNSSSEQFISDWFERRPSKGPSFYERIRTIIQRPDLVSRETESILQELIDELINIMHSTSAAPKVQYKSNIQIADFNHYFLPYSPRIFDTNDPCAELYRLLNKAEFIREYIWSNFALNNTDLLKNKPTLDF